MPEAKHVLPFAQLAKRSRIDLIWGYASISGVMFEVLAIVGIERNLCLQVR